MDRETIDLGAARTMLPSLREGRNLGLAPEGTRTKTGEIQEFKPGFVKVALMARVPILPTAIIGSFGILPTPFWFPRRANVLVRVGRLIDLHEYYGKKLSEEELVGVTRMIRDQVVELHNRPVDPLAAPIPIFS